jgi:di/tricarboxylate transporter
VLNVLVQSRRNRHAARRIMRMLLKKHECAPRVLITDKLKSYAGTNRDLGIACLLPQTRIMSVKEFADQVHITPLVYVAGFLGLGAVITESGLGARAANVLLVLTHMAPGSPVINVLLILGIGAVIGALTTLPALPAALTPLTGQLAHASGLPLYTVLMLQVPVFSTVFLPYRSPPMMIAMHIGGVSLRDGARLCVVLGALTVLFLLPIDYFWWRIVGMLPSFVPSQRAEI